MRYFRFAPRADNDVLQIVLLTVRKFGPRTSSRYRQLIDQAVFDLTQDAFRLGTHSRFDLQAGLYFYHLKHSRRELKASSERIHRPRHILAFRLPSAKELHILRVLHERMSLNNSRMPLNMVMGIHDSIVGHDSIVTAILLHRLHHITHISRRCLWLG